MLELGMSGSVGTSGAQSPGVTRPCHLYSMKNPALENHGGVVPPKVVNCLTAKLRYIPAHHQLQCFYGYAEPIR